MATNLIDLEHLIASAYERLVAAEVNDDGSATLFQRGVSGEVAELRVAFQPWLLVAGRALAERVPGAVAVMPLAADGELNFRVHFPDVKTCSEAARWLKVETGLNATHPLAPYRVFNDLQQQLLTSLPARLFRGLNFQELRRLQLDIETVTTPGFDFPNAERAGDEIIIVSLRDSTGWERSVAGPELSEKEILEEMVKAIRERDPDVIEGHNIFDFDLSYIAARCQRHRVKLALGRDGSRAQSRPSRFTAAELSSSYQRFTVYGRHVVDTMHLVQLYDIIHRDLESYGLKNVARHFGVAAPDRTYIAGAALTETFRADPELVKKYSLDDVRETDAISGILSPSYFYQAQLIPFSYQNCITRGSATRIDAMLVAGYMERNTGLPRAQVSRPFRGGLTESQLAGVFKNVWHVDIRSLYPSILVGGGIGPAQDGCGVFLLFLKELRRFRLQVKDAGRQAVDRAEKEHLEALQSTFKILINSFYGYLGFAQGTFNDFNLAEAVTATGRQILTGMVEFLKQCGAKVIELDTDGIYFVPPEGEERPEHLAADLQKTLPAGIDVDLDATYAAMFSYKSKNYALLSPEGEVSVTGAALKSRGLERFQRRYMHELITMLLTGKAADVGRMHARYTEAILKRQLPVGDLAKREVLSTSPRVYAEKLRSGEGRRSAAYEVALGAAREYRQGDQVAFYVTGNKKNVAVADAAKLLADADPANRDENIPYYLDKLDKLYAKFREFIPESSGQDNLPGF